MTPKDFLKSKKIWTGEVVSDMNAPENYFSLAELLDEYGKDQYNQAINDTVINAKTKKTGNSGSWYDAEVDEQSIIKLRQEARI